ncbi:hypothetical protein [Anaerobaca lacustris]|uniref:Uncharacterized protein n=1 Tax=Anaerobaca lacustris TaxID=3044600 RepID=A0AAW6U8M3_9BACT|nr:hypothetical protein [Sedimentisphaerales bacterium M17dextr]
MAGPPQNEFDFDLHSKKLHLKIKFTYSSGPKKRMMLPWGSNRNILQTAKIAILLNLIIVALFETNSKAVPTAFTEGSPSSYGFFFALCILSVFASFR